MIRSYTVYFVAACISVYLCYVYAQCRNQGMNTELRCQIMCDACGVDCYYNCLDWMASANCNNATALAAQLKQPCVRQIEACDLAATCCRTDYRYCVWALYNSVHRRR